ncbi:MAG: hypothetical protein ACM31P_00965 [Actinomycetota bacterium]
MTPPDIDQAIRRTTGFAALRQIRRLIDDEIALEKWRARWARRIGAAFAAIGGLLVIYILSRGF